MPVADDFVKEPNRLIYKFLWNGGLKMIDLDCMIKSLRLAWLQRITLRKARGNGISLTS